MDAANFLINITGGAVEKVIEHEISSPYEGLKINRILMYTYMLVALISILINVVLVVPIIRRKLLRKEQRNIIIINFIVFSILLQLSTVIEIMQDRYWGIFDRKHLCLLNQFELLFFVGTILIVNLFTIYWYTQLYCPTVFAKLSHYFKFIVGFVYVVLFVLLGLDLGFCYNDGLYIYSKIIVVSFLIIYVIFTVGINTLHFVKKSKLIDYKNVKNVSVLLTNLYFCSHLPMILFLMSDITALFEKVDLYLALIGVFTILLDPVYFFIILYRFDKDYYKCLQNTLCCNKYQEEFTEDTVVYDDNNVNIAKYDYVY